APVHGRETFVRQLLQPDVAANGQVQDGGGEVCDVDAFVDERADLSGLHVVGRMETQAVLVLPERGVVALYGFLAQSSFVSAAYSDEGDQTTDEHKEQDSEDARGGGGDGKGRGQRPALGEKWFALRRSLGVGDDDVEPVRGGHVGLEEVCHRGVRSHVGGGAVHGAAWFTGQEGQCLRGQVGGDERIGVRDYVAVGANGSPFHLNTIGDLAAGRSDPVFEYDVVQALGGDVDQECAVRLLGVDIEFSAVTVGGTHRTDLEFSVVFFVVEHRGGQGAGEDLRCLPFEGDVLLALQEAVVVERECDVVGDDGFGFRPVSEG